MLNIFCTLLLPNFYPVNLQHSSSKLYFLLVWITIWIQIEASLVFKTLCKRLQNSANMAGLQIRYSKICLKGMYYCQIEIIKGLTDKEQFQYLTKLKGPQAGNTCIQHNIFH